MDFIVLLVIFGVISSLTKNIKTIKNQNPNQTQQRNPSQPLVRSQTQVPSQKPSPSRYQSLTNTSTQNKPTQKMEASEALESVQYGFGRLIKSLTGEDIYEEAKRKEQKIEQDRLLKAKMEMEQEKEKLAQDAMDNSREQAEIWNKENQDINEIGDLPELEDLIVDEIGEDFIPIPMAKIKLSEAQQGIIWAEILNRPKLLQKGPQKPS